MTTLVEGEGAIASRRGITKLRSLAKATILGQGKLAVENWQKFGIAHWFSALEQLTTPSSCSKTVCISGKHHCSNGLHEEEEENSMEWGISRMVRSTRVQLPFNACSPLVVFEKAPIVWMEGGNFLLTSTLYTCSCGGWFKLRVAGTQYT